MKAAFFTYPSAFQNVGGGEVLLLKVKEYVEKEGVEVRLFDVWRDRVEQVDVLHVFGSVKDCLGLVETAKARGTKVVITPLWWSDWRRAFFTEGSLKTKVDFLLRHLAKLVYPSFPSARRKLLLSSDLVFPNSEMEQKQIQRLFAVSPGTMRIVHNGVDKAFLSADPGLFRSRYGSDPFVLGVGRIEPRKNQLNLIRAVARLKGKRLFLIGSPVSGYEAYFQKCQGEGKAFTTFLPTLDHGDPFLKSAYAACEVFVLQGWFETPGLAALEAALAGARVVATNGGSTGEYFRDFVEYMDPSRPADIARKIQKAAAVQKHDYLKNHVLQNFTWERVARDYVEFYREALGG